MSKIPGILLNANATSRLGSGERAGGEGEGDEDAKKFEIWKRPFSYVEIYKP